MAKRLLDVVVGPLDSRSPCFKLLAERDGYGILQVGPADFEDIFKPRRFFEELFGKFLEEARVLP